jgi:RHS repeat-associated protein
VSLAGWRSVETSFGYVESGDVGSRTTRVLSGAGVELARSDWKYEFDSNGRLWHVKLNGSQLVEYGYDANNLLRKATFATGDVYNFSYDDTTMRLTGSSQATAAGTVATTQRMGVRGLPDLEKIEIGPTSLSRKYEYWPQRFLLSSTDEQNKYFCAFDPFGLPKQSDRNDTSTSIVQSGGTIAAGSLVTQLDSLGRTIARGDLRLEYGPDGQVATARRGPSTWSFVYDEAGQRRLKLAESGPIAAYVEEGYLDENGLSEPISLGGRIVGLVRNGVFQTFATDLRGTVVADADLTPRVASPFGARDVHPVVTAAIDFLQKGYDADPGFVRMGVRDYDSESNRFTTPDPLFLESPELCQKSPTECNLYSYARSAPTAFSDPSGNESVGHHYVPNACTEKLIGLKAITDEAAQILRKTTTSSPDGVAPHQWSQAHAEYNVEVGDLIETRRAGGVVDAKMANEIIGRIKGTRTGTIGSFLATHEQVVAAAKAGQPAEAVNESWLTVRRAFSRAGGWAKATVATASRATKALPALNLMQTIGDILESERHKAKGEVLVPLDPGKYVIPRRLGDGMSYFNQWVPGDSAAARAYRRQELLGPEI